MRPRPSRDPLLVVLSVVLALLIAAITLLPAAADDPAAPPPDRASVEVGAAGDLMAYQPISHPVPYPPVPRPIIISGTVVYPWPYPWPYWCAWPIPFPPGVPPGFPTPVPPAPMPSPTPGGAASAATYTICPQILTRVPQAVQQQALAQPWTIYGYDMRKNPSVPYHPLWNPYRTLLALYDSNKPYSICNPVVWKAGCW